MWENALFNIPPFACLKSFLDEKAALYNTPNFIESDPISIPHRFSKKEDIEIAGFLSATIAWGNRKSIVTSANRMMQLMDESPFEFVMNHSASDIKRAKGFVHRTFNAEDFCQFIKSLRYIYSEKDGLENVLTALMKKQSNPQQAISSFKKIFFEKKHLIRTQKHVSDPMSGSSAKRINMYLRWMVRSDKRGVDFGLWKDIKPSQLSIPLDVHTGNIARKLGILHRTQYDWKAVEELDMVLRSFDANDPVKYDFALFGLGAIEKF
ncbi:MAG: TIGR02757 family protein [Flavobacteriales bacterium]